VEAILSVFADIWSANICDIYHLCDPGWTGEEAKPNDLAWSVSGEPFDVYPVYPSSGQYWLHSKSKQLVIAFTSYMNKEEKFALGQVAWRRGTLISKRRGYSSEILNRTPERYQDVVLWAWLEIFFFFSLRRGTNSKTTHYLLSYFFCSIP